LLRIILWPAMVVAWVLGLALAWQTGALGQGWFHVKVAAELALSAYHVWLSGYHKALAAGEGKLSGKQPGILNEVPGIAGAPIVILGGGRPL